MLHLTCLWDVQLVDVFSPASYRLPFLPGLCKCPTWNSWLQTSNSCVFGATKWQVSFHQCDQKLQSPVHFCLWNPSLGLEWLNSSHTVAQNYRFSGLIWWKASFSCPFFIWPRALGKYGRMDTYSDWWLCSDPQSWDVFPESRDNVLRSLCPNDGWQKTERTKDIYEEDKVGVEDSC